MPGDRVQSGLTGAGVCGGGLGGGEGCISGSSVQLKELPTARKNNRIIIRGVNRYFALFIVGNIVAYGQNRGNNKRREDL
ncbi:hypothetical protein ES703_123287 [subsurface metagenome]